MERGWGERMTTNLEFDVKDSTTLADFKELLNELQLDILWEIGGDEGSIQYDFEGHVWVYDLEDDELKKVLNIILKNPRRSTLPFISPVYWSTRMLAPLGVERFTT